ncbi:hypothetical protein OG948_38715 (plasmid) [Embleya sp. NBC_00888]|uniref:hypothetical protein n=1 Tax=Embleya sp. NBC_00888 TaxID=2975960 RepID=UPI002F91AAFD|nr:hypothetical protein OG948_38715 [Embleya sp. NBC_00888]
MLSQSEGGQSHPLEASLSGVLDSPGVIGAALIDAVTGLVYAEVGDCRALGNGTELADLTNLVTDRLTEAGADGEVESVVVNSRRYHQITQVLPRRGDDFLLATVVDRAETNLALAIRATAEHARDVLA